MSPEQRRDFESEWPRLVPRLQALLARKNISAAHREDLIQETALRLYAVWDRVDRSRPAWALTMTIALNLVRDQARRLDLSSTFGQVPETVGGDDVENAALARVELAQVKTALSGLSVLQRSALLEEIGIHNGANDGNTAKMRRMRARRKLKDTLDRGVGLLLFPARRLLDVTQAMLSLRDAVARAGSCAVCMLLGLGSLVAVPSGPEGPGIAADYEYPGTGAIAVSADDTFVAGSVVVAPDSRRAARAERGSRSGGTRAGGGRGGEPRRTGGLTGTAIPVQVPIAAPDPSGGVTVPAPPGGISGDPLPGLPGSGSGGGESEGPLPSPSLPTGASPTDPVAAVDAVLEGADL